MWQKPLVTVTCLWLTSDFSWACGGQFPGAHFRLVLLFQYQQNPLGLQAGSQRVQGNLQPTGDWSHLNAPAFFQVEGSRRHSRYFSEVCLHQWSWTHTLMWTCPFSLAFPALSLLPPRITSHINCLHSLPCFSHCYGGTQAKIGNLCTLLFLICQQVLPLRNSYSSLSILNQGSWEEHPGDTNLIFQFLILFQGSVKFATRNSFSSTPSKHPSSIPTSKVDI